MIDNIHFTEIFLFAVGIFVFVMYLFDSAKQKKQEQNFRKAYEKAAKTMLVQIDEINDKNTNVYLMYDGVTNAFLGQAETVNDLLFNWWINNRKKETIIAKFSKTNEVIEIQLIKEIKI